MADTWFGLPVLWSPDLEAVADQLIGSLGNWLQTLKYKGPVPFSEMAKPSFTGYAKREL